MSVSSNMPQKVACLFKELSRELGWINIKWKIYCGLYGESQERRALLARTAPLCFLVFRDTLIDDVIISLSRLSDPPGSRDKKNVSFPRLREEVSQASGPAVATRFQDAVDKLLDISKELRRIRHTCIAHTDLETSQGGTALLSREIGSETVSLALQATGDAMDALKDHYDHAEWRYDFDDSDGGPDDLLYFLELGVKHSDNNL